MSEVRILLRWTLLVPAALVLAACASSGSSGGSGTQLANPCRTGPGTAERSAPIVCVDDTGATLTVNPDPIEVHDEGAGRAPVVIHWWTRSGSNDLGIEIEPGCVTAVNCRGGHCMARTLPKDGGSARCKYDVWTGKHPRLDPEVIIVDCCSP
jgi:hypothetical protein